MGFKHFAERHQGIALLQRSLERQRLAHGYLFTGHDLGELEMLARTLAKTLNCLEPVKREGVAVDCCDHCLSCRKIEHGNHADVHWLRPESRIRIITVGQMRELIKEIQLKPSEAGYKVAIVVAADRLKSEAANAFLKTLEEPPPKSVLILLSTDPQRMLETVLSRCLRLNFGGKGLSHFPADWLQWLATFSEMAAAGQTSLLGRYRLMDILLGKLTTIKAAIDSDLTGRSPLQHYKDAEKEVIEKWEDELSASIESEYRRQRADLLTLVECWLRDVWLLTFAGVRSPKADAREVGASTGSAPGSGLLSFPEMDGPRRVAARISAADATANLSVVQQLQRRLNTNVQEALALEVGLLKLHL